MRINQLNNNNTQLNSISDLGLLKIGQMLKARVIEAVHDVLLLDLGGGKLIEAKTTIPLDFSNQNHINFVVTEINHNQILISPVDDSINKIAQQENKIIQLLKEIGVHPNSENIDLVKQMLFNDISITKQNVTDLYKLKLSFEKLEELLQGQKISIPYELANKNVGEALKLLLTSSKEFLNSTEQSIDINSLSNFDLTSDIKAETLVKDHIHTSIKEFIDVNKKIDSSSVPFSQVNIGNIGFDKIIFLLKNKLDINMINATYINDIIQNHSPITKRLDALVKSFVEKENTTTYGKNLESTFTKVRAMIENKDFKPQEIIKELYIKLELIKQNIEKNYGSKDNFNFQEIEAIKNGLDFMNKISQLHSFIQIPIHINQQNKNLEIYIHKDNKKQKKLNPNDLKIFISLETKTLDLIQVYLEIKEKYIYCDFQTSSEKNKKFIAKFENNIKNKLISMGYEQVYIKFSISKNVKDILDINNRDDDLLHFIDLRV